MTSDELVRSYVSALRNLSASCAFFGKEIEQQVAIRSTNPGGPPLTRPEYDEGPIGEIAARLRKLLVPTRGDEVLQRVCSATGADVPTIRLSADAKRYKPEWNKIAIEYLVLGAVPAGDDYEGDPVPLSEVGGRSCLVVLDPDEPPAQTVTWQQLIKDVGDKDGVHVDDQRPMVWDFINQYHVGGVPIIPLLLYRLAMAVVEAGNDVLNFVGVAPVEVPIFTAANNVAQQCTGFVAAERVNRPGPRPGRNDPCPCGDGYKFKRCCGR